MMNRTIKLLILADVFTVTGFGLIDPILAIYIKDDLTGGSIIAAGLASTVFLAVKCLIQLPFSRWVDKHDHRVSWLIRGSLLVACAPFIYMIAGNIWTFYLASLVQGIGSGLVYPTWLGLFSTHLDKHNESFEWSLYSTLTGLATAATAAIGATVAQFFGFTATFVMVSALALCGCAILLGLERGNDKIVPPGLSLYHRKIRAGHGRLRH